MWLSIHGEFCTIQRSDNPFIDLSLITVKYLYSNIAGN